MALFSHGLYDQDPSFTPLFRLLDEFDKYSREARGSSERPRHGGRNRASTFNPRFDVRETDSTYELYGELPGIDRDKINIEFTDSQSLVIRGRAEHTYGATVENGGAHDQPKEPTGSGEESSSQEKTKRPFEKFWVRERPVGEFARAFNFPSRVDLDSVSASLNNGVLSLVVPKAKKHEVRRITIA
ncbi:uncharacterized protein THITE_2113195 [Thermothielavioides terrestris NRRL 8126]|uniref:SHSP domain-containing protein n=1 Tax=Thermothielavioides terrestris (strain ATCC 38088 / NRRL 8126) TaxID=578455 RepID=G2R200_THETT|nr:uncharacterized protein THITE_2113195 [Thermothielavioides terrestris NRRL 8126]AEO65781.1 hypothetical protein THITE_2113195 [Thermothielavioides terrestris NRRL 8126]